MGCRGPWLHGDIWHGGWLSEQRKWLAWAQEGSRQHNDAACFRNRIVHYLTVSVQQGRCHAFSSRLHLTQGKGWMEGCLGADKPWKRTVGVEREKGLRWGGCVRLTQRATESPSIAPSCSLFHQLIAPIRQIEGGSMSLSDLWSVSITLPQHH